MAQCSSLFFGACTFSSGYCILRKSTVAVVFQQLSWAAAGTPQASFDMASAGVRPRLSRVSEGRQAIRNIWAWPNKISDFLSCLVGSCVLDGAVIFSPILLIEK